MQQEYKLTDDLDHLFHHLNQEDREGKDDQETEEGIEEIDVYFVRRPKEGEQEVAQIIDSTPQQRPRRTMPVASFIALAVNVLFFLSVFIFSILPELTTSVTITLIPVEKQISSKVSLIAVSGIPTSGQIPARFLPSFTLTQSQTVPATGKGHQNAQNAVGLITFYNGQFISQIIAAGTTLTGNDGVQVITDQEANIPAANPPSLGIATVPAHAIHPGQSGNLPARDINQACCLASVFAQNTYPFKGGQNERDYMFVTKADIQNAGQALTTTVAASENAALQTQLTTHEGLITPPCTPTVTSDHREGDEAQTVTVTVSENCTGIAYDSITLQEQATQLLTHQATSTLGTGYSLLGDIQLTILHATINKTNGIATIVVSMSGTWVYQFTQQTKQDIKHLIAGKQKSDALYILLSLPGIQGAHIKGIADSKSIPTDTTRIHIVLLYGISSYELRFL